ncbi:MAG: cytochrome c [Ignavibacteria bacterium]|nr:cytochrome c [Ignavibacteria bacterium]
MKNRKILIILAAISIIALAGFLTVRNSKLHELGVGPVKELKLSSTIDEKLVTHGKQLFDSKCAMCHMMNQCKVGPLMQGVTKRRKPEYIMNMILNPVEMTQSNATAEDQMQKYGMQMPAQNLSEEDARALLEYFRSYDK